MTNKYKNPNSLHQILYLLPQQWWAYIQSNIEDTDFDGFQNNTLIETFKQSVPKLECFIQTISKHMKQQAIDKISQKLSFINIDNFTLNPKLQNNTQWKIVSENNFYKFSNILKDLINYYTLPFTFENSNISYQNALLIDQQYIQEQVLILFCSNSQNHLYMGYHKKGNIQIETLKKLIQFFGYQETDRTKIIFPNENSLKKYTLQDIEFVKTSQLIMVYDLKRYDQVQYTQEYEEFQKGLNFLPQQLIYQSHYDMRSRRNQEDQITMADLDSQSRIISQHTLSTGAQTPSFTSFLLDQQDQRQFRTHNLFGQRKPEQIQIMREYARQVIHNKLIDVKYKQELDFQLQKIAEQIQQTLYKKKHCKESKDYKDFLSLKESFHHFQNTLQNRQSQGQSSNY